MHPGPWWIVSLVSARENPSNVAAFGGDRPLAQKTGSAQTCGRESSVARTFLYCRSSSKKSFKKQLDQFKNIVLALYVTICPLLLWPIFAFALSMNEERHLIYIVTFII